MSHIRTAVFPVAGLGTRFLPATKTVPKEMLPVLDRPLIQYAVDEARAAGIERFIFVTSAGKPALENYFDRAEMLESRLQAAGKTDPLQAVQASQLPEGRYSFVRQSTPRGLGHAVAVARHLVGEHPFAVILPDDLIRAPRSALGQMIEAHRKTQGHMVATMEVPAAQTSSYGVIDPGEVRGRIMQAKGLIEKPKPGMAPSRQAVIGRYILEPSIFARLENLGPGAGGEVQLTDAINAEVSTAGVTGFQFDGDRFDCGSVAGYVEATLAFALARPELEGAVQAAFAGMTAPVSKVA